MPRELATWWRLRDGVELDEPRMSRGVIRIGETADEDDFQPPRALEKLRDAEQDDLVRLLPDRVEVTPLGRLFLRNLAMPFDAYLQRRAPDAKPIFSKTL